MMLIGLYDDVVLVGITCYTDDSVTTIHADVAISSVFRVL